MRERERVGVGRVANSLPHLSGGSGSSLAVQTLSVSPRGHDRCREPFEGIPFRRLSNVVSSLSLSCSMWNHLSPHHLHRGVHTRLSAPSPNEIFLDDAEQIIRRRYIKNAVFTAHGSGTMGKPKCLELFGRAPVISRERESPLARGEEERTRSICFSSGAASTTDGDYASMGSPVVAKNNLFPPLSAPNFGNYQRSAVFTNSNNFIISL